LGETKGGVVLAVLVSLLAMVHKTFLEQLHAQSFIFVGHKLQQDTIFLFDNNRYFISINLLHNTLLAFQAHYDMHFQESKTQAINYSRAVRPENYGTPCEACMFVSISLYYTIRRWYVV
jgi:hypothetical protein